MSKTRAVMGLTLPAVLFGGGATAVAQDSGGSTSAPNLQAELPAPVPPADRLTLEQALDTGLRHNPQSAVAAYSVESARQNYNGQRAPINPTVTYGGLNNTVAPLDWASGFSQGSNYSVYATLETNGAIRYRTWQAREQWHQAEFDAATTGLSLKQSIVNAYVALQVANRALEVEQRVYGNIHRLTELTRRRYETGAGPQADLTRAKISEIQEVQNVISDAANVSQARATLNQQLGRPQTAPVDAADPLVYRKVDFPALDRLLRQAEGRRPELKSALANLQSLRAVPGLQRSAYYPNVVLATDLGGDGVFLGLTVPIDLGGIRGAVAKADADIKTQAAQVEVQRQSIDLEVRSSYDSFAAAQRAVDTYDGGLLTMSQTLVDQVRHGYELGANSIVDVITAENTYRSVESTYYAAVGSYVQAVYTLRHAVGDLPAAGALSGPGATAAPMLPAPLAATSLPTEVRHAP